MHTSYDGIHLLSRAHGHKRGSRKGWEDLHTAVAHWPDFAAFFWRAPVAARQWNAIAVRCCLRLLLGSLS